MTRNFFKHIFIFLIAITAFTNSLYADVYTFEDFNFVMDIPEGLYISDANQQGTDFYFESKLMPVKFALKFYSDQEYKNPQNMIDDVLKKLNAKGTVEQLNWFNRKCYLSTLAFVMSDQKLYQGWAFATQVDVKDNPKQKENILMITYADKEISRDCDQFMLSIIDSIILSPQDFRRPGPVTSLAFEDSNTEKVVLKIAGQEINSSAKKDAIERSNFVVEREQAVLKLYAKHKNWKEAWQRYYRQIFRESYNSLDTIATDVYKALLPKAQKENINFPQGELIQMLLDWTQDMQYARDKEGTDFTAPIAAALGYGSDCDSRSMLMCILLEHFGLSTELFISREYSHAVFGVAVNQAGAAIEANGINYVLGETTAKVNFGLIAKEQSDSKKWIEVDLP